MNTIKNPSKEQITEFAKNLESNLHAAIDRGSSVEIGIQQETKELFNPEYGQIVVDEIYIGAEFKAKFRERGY